MKKLILVFVMVCLLCSTVVVSADDTQEFNDDNSITETNETESIDEEKPSLKSISLKVSSTIIASGTCGTSVSWSLYDDGTLLIGGNGTMPNYSYGSTPWYQHKDSIINIVIENSVTSIGDWAFYWCLNLASLSIPDSVTTIGEDAFAYCPSLTSLTMPISATIERNSFTEVTNLTSVTLTPGTGIGANYTFETSLYTPWYKSRGNLTSLTLSEGITSIGSYTFNNCYNLEFITLPDSTISINEGAFNYCPNLSSITIPNSVTSIGDFAFGSCSSLTSITIPNSVTTIGFDVFGSCSNLASINVDSNNPNYMSIDGVLFEKTNNEPAKIIRYPIGKVGSSYVIPNTVTSIEIWSFFGCSNLTSVVIPDSVISIDVSAFASCSNLTAINVDSNNPNYMSIDGVLFEKNNNLPITLIKYPNGNSELSYTIPNSVTSIGVDAFWRCVSLTTITISNSVTTIGNSAFSDCTDLTSITIPNSVTSIGERAFGNCPNVTIHIGNSDYAKNYCIDNNINYVYDIEDSVIAEGDIDSIHWSLLNNGTLTLSGTGNMSNYTSEDQYPWYSYMNSMTSVVIENGITSIGDHAFSKYSNLTSITIPDSVTSIGDYAFYDCSSLSSITIPDSVTSIGAFAFGVCSSLTSINTPDSVTSIGDYAFYDCSSLSSITIPDSVTSIGAFAFYGCSSLTSITIPDSVTAIGDATFFYCSSLTSITIPDSVKSIGSSAFNNCTSLTSITIPDSVKSIGSGAFSTCSSLTSITIPNSVTSIGYSAFYNCSSLSSITIPDSVTSIGDFAFTACSSLTSITIPNSVTSIGYSAFYNCSSLSSITIPNSVTSIGNLAFYNYSSNHKLGGYENSYLQQYCLNNSLTYVELSKVSNKIINGTLEQNGTISLKVTCEIDESVDRDNAYVLINNEKTYLKDLNKDGNNYTLKIPQLSPKHLSDNFTVTYYDENDRPISDNATISVKSYINSLINDENTSTKAKAFYKSLLNYAANAQEYFRFNTEDLANSELLEADKDVSNVNKEEVAEHAPSIVGVTEGIRAFGQDLNIAEEIDYRIYFQLEDGHNINEYVFTLDGVNVKPQKYSNNMYYVNTEYHAAPDLGVTHNIAVTRNNEGSLNVSVSVISYAHLVLRNEPTSTSDIKLQNLMKSLYLYYNNAKQMLEG